MINLPDGLPDKFRLTRLMQKLDNFRADKPDLALTYRLGFGNAASTSTMAVTSAKGVYHIELYEDGAFALGRIDERWLPFQDEAICMDLAFSYLTTSLDRKAESANGSFAP